MNYSNSQRAGVILYLTALLFGGYAETAKANNLKPYDYFEYLLTEIPKHLDVPDRSFLDDLLPWSPSLPENCRKHGKNKVE